MDPNDILESSLNAKEKIISELNAELRSIESTLSTEKEMHVNELKKLTALLSEKVLSHEKCIVMPKLMVH